MDMDDPLNSNTISTGYYYNKVQAIEMKNSFDPISGTLSVSILGRESNQRKERNKNEDEF